MADAVPRKMSVTIMAAILFCLFLDGDGIMLNTISNDTSADLYRAPPGFDGNNENPSDLTARARPLPSFIITSRPLMFSQENSADGSAESGERQTSNSAATTITTTATTKRWPWQKFNKHRPPGAAHSTKVTLTYHPGKATVVCKGVSCSQQGSFSSSASGSASSNYGFYGTDVNDDDDDTGFAGEAIPIDATDDFTTVVMNEKKPILLPVTERPKKPNTGVIQTHTSTVHLLTKRPYLNRVRPSTSKRSTTLSVSYIRKRSTTSAQRRRSTSVRPSTVVRRRQTTTTTTTTVRPKPQQSAPLSRPSGGGGSRPSFFFPAAMTAFTLMALPMAAAAFPFLLQVGRKRRSTAPETALERIRALHRPGHDFETLVQELEKILEKDASVASNVNNATFVSTAPPPEAEVMADSSSILPQSDIAAASASSSSTNDRDESRRIATAG